MKRVTEIITPDKARQLLSTYTGTSDIDSHKVSFIAEKIRSGRWVEDNGFFLYVRGGVLLNGRHRLSAIIELNEPLQMRVQYD